MTDCIRVERTTTYNPTIDAIIREEMLEFYSPEGSDKAAGRLKLSPDEGEGRGSMDDAQNRPES